MQIRAAQVLKVDLPFLYTLSVRGLTKAMHCTDSHKSGLVWFQRRENKGALIRNCLLQLAKFVLECLVLAAGLFLPRVTYLQILAQLRPVITSVCLSVLRLVSVFVMLTCRQLQTPTTQGLSHLLPSPLSYDNCSPSSLATMRAYVRFIMHRYVRAGRCDSTMLLCRKGSAACLDRR